MVGGVGRGRLHMGLCGWQCRKGLTAYGSVWFVAPEKVLAAYGSAWLVALEKVSAAQGFL